LEDKVLHITARYYGFFSKVTGKISEVLDVADDATVRKLIDELAEGYGYRFEQLCFIRPLYSDRDYANLCLNTLDLNITKKFPDGLETRLEEGDVVSFGVMGGAA